MKEKLMEVLTDVRPDVDFENEKSMIDDSVLDSFDIISIVAGLNEAFDIDINVDDLVPDNFNSIEGLIALVEEKTAE